MSLPPLRKSGCESLDRGSQDSKLDRWALTEQPFEVAGGGQAGGAA